jgi:glutaminyl-tRNA synthetase
VGVTKNDGGDITGVHCRYEPESLKKDYTGGPKAKATLHWVSAKHSEKGEVRLYDRLFSVENPEEQKENKDFKSYLNPNSLEVVKTCQLEPGLSDAKPGSSYQFERLGYFCVDPDSTAGFPVFNRTVTLRDAWAKIVKRESK